MRHGLELSRPGSDQRVTLPMGQPRLQFAAIAATRIFDAFAVEVRDTDDTIPSRCNLSDFAKSNDETAGNFTVETDSRTSPAARRLASISNPTTLQRPSSTSTTYRSQDGTTNDERAGYVSRSSA